MARKTKRYVIRLKFTGRQIYFYYCGQDLGWGNIEYAIQYLGEPLARDHMNRLVYAYGLEDQNHFEEISTVVLAQELENEKLFFERRVDRNNEALSVALETRKLKEQELKKKEVENKIYEVKSIQYFGRDTPVHCMTCKCFRCERSPIYNFRCKKCWECIDSKTRYKNWNRDKCRQFIPVNESAKRAVRKLKKKGGQS